MRKIIICDIDGTIAIKGDRSIFDYAKCSLDSPNKPIVDIVKRFIHDTPVFFVSGREDFCRPQTLHWLIDLFPERHHVEVFMRKTGDHRKDTIVKKEIYEREIKNKYDVLFVLDDRTQVVDMWRQEGLTVLQVAEGNF